MRGKKLPEGQAVGGAKLLTGQTFQEGVRHRAIQFSFHTREHSRMFWLGYFLWGMDVWVENVPVMKTVIAVNIINMIIMWIVR